MTLQEKREERFKRWLNPKNIKFASPKAENLYIARVTRFIKAIKMEVPDRVPCILPTGYFPAYYAGVTFRDIDLPPIAIPPVRSKCHSLSPQEQVVGNRASYVVGCDYTPASIVQSRLSLLSVS